MFIAIIIAIICCQRHEHMKNTKKMEMKAQVELIEQNPAIMQNIQQLQINQTTSQLQPQQVQPQVHHQPQQQTTLAQNLQQLQMGQMMVVGAPVNYYQSQIMPIAQSNVPQSQTKLEPILDANGQQFQDANGQLAYKEGVPQPQTMLEPILDANGQQLYNADGQPAYREVMESVHKPQQVQQPYTQPVMPSAMIPSAMPYAQPAMQQAMPNTLPPILPPTRMTGEPQEQEEIIE